MVNDTPHNTITIPSPGSCGKQPPTQEKLYRKKGSKVFKRTVAASPPKFDRVDPWRSPAGRVLCLYCAKALATMAGIRDARQREALVLCLADTSGSKKLDNHALHARGSTGGETCLLANYMRHVRTSHGGSTGIITGDTLQTTANTLFK